MNQNTKNNGANVKFPPPLVYIIWMIMGAILQNCFLTDMGIPFNYQYWGLGMVIGGVFLIIYFQLLFKKMDTNIKPWEPTKNIITTGVYAYSRNPIYVVFNIFPIGLGIFFDNLWVLLSFIPALYTVYYLAIKKEEAYLEATFGEEYLDYKKKVRRWI
ncbi:MAG: isoprenylcysteine carboxylmethyltransferase family protein [Candidatus Marinimicrobia bacterium]|nr:isoprenylcysteine carboxylmethyltransferase family protein [Candidatus Neomarinimicrobiota bacterium]